MATRKPRTSRTPSRASAIGGAFSLLAGAGAGILAMYLLDPASGRRRRHALAEHARDAVDAGRGWIGRAGHTVSDSDSSRARQFVDHAREHIPEISLQPRHVPIPVLPGIVGGVAMLALGAALVYLLDPDLGESRRNSIRNRVHDSITDTGEFFRRAGSRIRGRVHASGHDLPIEREVVSQVH